MTFTVTRSSGVMARPSKSTPSGTLNLSAIDKLPIFQMKNRVVYVFRHGHNAAQVIREALSKALVPYYPLAGRLKESSNGELQVACTGEGAWFVEACANYSLDSANYFHDPFMFLREDLLPTPPPESCGIHPILQIQVTRFKCEGFVMGMILPHSICDGLGAGQFLNAVGEFARGFQHPTIEPVWHREAIPAPRWLVGAHENSNLLQPPPPTFPSFNLEHASIDISLEQINKIKKEFFELTANYCSTFDVVVASLWCNRTRAIELEKHTKVSIVFLASTRQLIDPPVPQGFYGNCIYPVSIATSSGWLVEAPISEVVKLIKDAKARVPSEFEMWLKRDELDSHNGDPFVPQLEYTTLVISEWTGLGFNNIDYGWGHPLESLSIQQGLSFVPHAIVGFPPPPMKGIRLMTCCVSRTHLPSLLTYYKNDTSSRL